MHTTCGLIVLMGSGETSLAGGRVIESIVQTLPAQPHIAILETPAGFELNSQKVAGRVADFLMSRLQNYQPQIDVVPARKRGTSFSPDDPRILKPLMQADLIFMGAGSPTFAVRQLFGSLAWNIVRARNRLGAALVFTSAATIAVGARILPVYEIYKVGEDITSPAGLSLFTDFGLDLSCVPHWNNTDGGEDVDTSRCFIGMERFQQWCALLPPGHTVLGIDEHTSVIIDFPKGYFTVNGVSSITLLQNCAARLFPTGSILSIDALGLVKCQQKEIGIPVEVWKMVQKQDPTQNAEALPVELQQLLDKRTSARARGDWYAADALRDQINLLGWNIQDTPDGQKLINRKI